MSTEFRSAEKIEEALSEEISEVERQPEIEAAASVYAGLDAEEYLGDPAMDVYKSAGFSVACVYLSNMPHRIQGKPNNRWIQAAAGLARHQWGLAPTYVGAQASKQGAWPPINPAVEAPIDAAEAVQLARDAGFVEGQTIFLDVEAAFGEGSAQESYVFRWFESVHAAGFKTALYCFPSQISWAQKNKTKIWTVHLYKPTSGQWDKVQKKPIYLDLPAHLPFAPIDAGSVGTQCGFWCHAAGRTDDIDYDRWTVPDPSKM
jgi:hypothetical protein